jgi:hypothetical protein
MAMAEEHVLVREFSTEAGFIDLVGLDSKGEILVIETKLACNTDRRRVIAQAIDYAAQLTQFGTQGFLDQVRHLHEDDFDDQWFESGEQQKTFLRELEANLSNGRLTILIVMDEADELLKDSIRFINRATEFNCLLAEVKVSMFEGEELVSVDLYGDEGVEEKNNRPKQQPPLTPGRFIKSKEEHGLAKEAKAFIEAWGKYDDNLTSKTAVGFCVEQENFVGYNYLSWQIEKSTMEVWATEDIFKRRKDHFENPPNFWRGRINTRINPIKNERAFGRLADISVEEATKTDFVELFEFFNNGPMAKSS